MNIENILVDMDQHRAFRDGEELIMPMKEFDLHYYLMTNKGRVLTREQLLDHVWEYDYVCETRTVDVHVRHLRIRIEKNPDDPKIIETVRGAGYKMVIK